MRVKPYDERQAEVWRFTQEGPHVVFTRKMKTLSEQICGAERNPVRQAKKFYDWIADNISYSYAIEYSTVRNLGDIA